jgi:hypothetical protein
MSRSAFGWGIGIVAVLLVAGGIGLLARHGERGYAPTPSGAVAPEPPAPDSGRYDPLVASRAMDRLHLFRTGNAGDQLRLEADEITAVLRHAIPGVVPAGVSEPRVRLEGGKVRLTARISSEAFPGAALLTPLLEVLPDTLDIDIRGSVVRDVGGLAFRIERVSAEHVPVPESVVAAVVSSMIRSGTAKDPAPHAGEPPTLHVAWPSGVSFLYVWEDGLVLERRRSTQTGVDGSDH